MALRGIHQCCSIGTALRPGAHTGADRLVTISSDDPRHGSRAEVVPAAHGRAPPWAGGMSAEMTSGEPAARATLAEVAALADVSISTVSKVLNGRTGVSAETRARIKALLQDHQYNRRSPGRTIPTVGLPRRP